MKYAKAIATFLTGGATLAATVLGPAAVAWITPELAMSVGTVVGTVLVWAIPNKG